MENDKTDETDETDENDENDEIMMMMRTMATLLQIARVEHDTLEPRQEPERRIDLEAITCPNGHTLKYQISDTHRCDACGDVFDMGLSVLGCRSCNYNACLPCCTPPTHPMIFESERA